MIQDLATIFTDGASRGNPGPGGFGAVIIAARNIESGIPNIEVKELGGREEHTTNNRMELQAAISALSYLKSSNLNLPTLIYSDSSYLLNGITKWVFGWRKNNWITSQKQPVENRDLWETLFSLAAGKKISWKQVGGHVGVAGNERCDEIATAFADGGKPKLYSGPLEKYPIKNILDIAGDTSRRGGKEAARARTRARAYSYVSVVLGKLGTHKTWAECEARVKGQSGAKYKKALSAEDELEIISEWSKK